MQLYCAHSGSGLSRLSISGSATPYWAYPWAGGLALARYIHEQPETVAGRRIFDFGAGSGLVAIAAALAGASRAVAVETDPFGRAAIAANSVLNGVEVEVSPAMPRVARDADLIVAGDVFYARSVGRRSLRVLERWRVAGIGVLIGDPYRADLPLARLRCLRDYAVPDVGSGRRETRSGIFMLETEGAAGPTKPPPRR